MYVGFELSILYILFVKSVSLATACHSLHIGIYSITGWYLINSLLEVDGDDDFESVLHFVK